MSRVERELNKRINNTTEIDAETKIKEKKRERIKKECAYNGNWENDRERESNGERQPKKIEKTSQEWMKYEAMKKEKER